MSELRNWVSNLECQQIKAMTRISRESLSEKIPRSQFFLLTVSSLYLSLSHSWLSSPLTQTKPQQFCTSWQLWWILSDGSSSSLSMTNARTKLEQRAQILSFPQQASTAASRRNARGARVAGWALGGGQLGWGLNARTTSIIPWCCTTEHALLTSVYCTVRFKNL